MNEPNRILSPKRIEKLLSLSLLFVIAMFGLQFRIETIDFRWFSMDEIIQYQNSMKSFADMLDFIWTHEVHPPGFYLFTYLWSHMTAPYNQSTLKLLTVFLGFLGILSVYAASVRQWGWVAGVASAAFYAFSPAEIAQSTNFRMYCAFGIGVGLFHLALAELTASKPKKQAFFFLVASGFFLSWFNHLALIYQFTVLLAWIFLHRHSLDRRLILKILGFSLSVNLIPIVYFVKQSFINAHYALDWIPRFSIDVMLSQTLGILLNFHPPMTPRWVLILLIPLFVFLLWVSLKRPSHWRELLLLGLGLILVPSLLIVKSSLSTPIYYWRYNTFIVSVFSILVGYCVWLSRRRTWLAWALSLGLAGLFYQGHPYFSNFVVKHEWKELIEHRSLYLENDFLTCAANELRIEAQFHFAMNALPGKPIGDLCEDPSLVDKLPDRHTLVIAEPFRIDAHREKLKKDVTIIKTASYWAYSLYFIQPKVVSTK